MIGLRRRISAGGSIENQDLASRNSAAGHQQEIVNRVDAHTGSAGAAQFQLGVRPAQNPLRRDISLGHAVEHQDCLIAIGDEDFVVLRIDAYLAHGGRTPRPLMCVLSP